MAGGDDQRGSPAGLPRHRGRGRRCAGGGAGEADRAQDALGPEAALSKSTLAAVCTRIRDEFDAWRRRDRSGLRLDYLFLDASHFKMHAGHTAEPVLAAWGITTDGKPVFVGLDSANSESTDAWHGFLTDLADRGLVSRLLVISDGAKGLISAAEQVFPKTLSRGAPFTNSATSWRRSARTTRRPSAPTSEPASTADEQLKDIEPGQRLVEAVQRRIDAFIEKWAGAYPAAMRAMAADRASLTVYLRFPAEHHKRIRRSNFIERTFGETRRRVKVIGRFPGETSCVSLVWAVLDCVSRGWRGFTMTPQAFRTLQDLRRALLEPPTTLYKLPRRAAFPPLRGRCWGSMKTKNPHQRDPEPTAPCLTS
ncbi:transposase [Streptomyces sp. NPDC046712]|uniref:IS256 family transposase n=1 Tax=Streptomyces sp. NPDC046712 TaxID=3154802 RepID=UPI0033D3C392